MKRNLWNVLLLAIACHAISAVAAVGRTPGTANVSKSGAFTYHIPISSPSGPGGIQPQLSLDYNSQAGNGPLGMGWSINGLSAISRCNRTVAQDGSAAAITLTSTDVFCLNGKRLRLVSGTYGYTGSTYQTEIADFSNIRAYGTTGTGPSYFVVQGRDGRTYEYGNGGNSQVLASGSTSASAWMLNRVTDRAGNRMVIAYLAANQNENLRGTTVPTTISWVPTSHGAGTYLYSMQFGYELIATPISVGYLAGTLVQNHHLLTNISVQNSGTTIKKYVLGYSSSTTTLRQTLTSVKECADAAATDCLAPTTMVYQSGQQGLVDTPQAVASGINTSGLPIGSVDLNGDGCTDATWKARPSSGSPLTQWVAFGICNGIGYSTPFDTAIPSSYGQTNVMLGDVDGSGVDGFMIARNDNLLWFYKWNGASFAGQSTGISVHRTQPSSQIAQAVLADLNGDGLRDLVLHYGGGDNFFYVRLNTSSNGVVSFGSEIKTIASVGWNTYNQPDGKIDVFGDGRANLFEQTYSQGIIYNWVDRFNGTTFERSLLSAVVSSLLPDGTGPVDVADYNDDGCTDVLFKTLLAVSVCNSSTAYNISFDTTAFGDVTALAGIDWNGDGRKDIVVQLHDQLAVYFSVGNGMSELAYTYIPIGNGAVGTATYRGAHNAAGDGLDGLLMIQSNTNIPQPPSFIHYYRHNGQGQHADLLTSVTDGFGVNHSPQYSSIGNGSYTKGSGAVYPEVDWTGALYVVSQLPATDGIGGTYTRTYAYAGARQNMWGRGLDFSSIVTTDSRPNAPVTKTFFETTFPLSGMVSEEDVYQPDGTTLISKTTYTNSFITLDNSANRQRYFPYVESTATDTYEVGGSKNGQRVSSSDASFTYDNYGNVTSSTETVTDTDGTSPQSPTYNHTWTTVTTNTVVPDTLNWCLGIPTQTTVQQYATGVPSIARTVGFTPDYVNCRIAQEVTEPNSSTYAVTTNYGYDSFGNINSASVTANGVAESRTTSVNWGTTGRFPEATTDALGFTSYAGYDDDFGVQSSATDPNGLTTTWSYDNFGRRERETRPDNTYATYGYDYCASLPGGCQNGDPYSSAVAINKMVITTTQRQTNGTAIREDRAYLDQFDRTIVVNTQTLSGDYSRVGRQYDAFGRLHRQTAPCNAASCTAYWTTHTYDVLGRITQQSRPVSASDSTTQSTGIGYQGHTTIVTDPQGKRRIKAVDPNGWLRVSEDSDGYSQAFGYDAFGSLISVTDDLGTNLFSATYVYGIGAFRLSTTDADRGAWTYNYDAFGQTTSWQDPNGDQFVLTYDKLSRPTSRAQVSRTQDEITNWTWGASAANRNIGQLAELTRWQWEYEDGQYVKSYDENFTYDSIGRLVQRQLENTGDCGDCSYNWQYDSATGLIDTLTYPRSTSSYRLRLKYAYGYGVLREVSAVSESPQIALWRANTSNARGQVTQATLGNGIVTNRNFDAVAGWLNSVQSGLGGGAAIQNQSYLYDRVGNVTQRQNNNLGLTENFYYDNLYRLDRSTLNNSVNLDMSYDPMGNITSKSDIANGASWSYHPTKKHAVVNAGGNTYAYDASGNVTSRNGQQIQWSPLHQMTHVGDLFLTYTPDGRRLSQSSNGVTVQFVGESFEHVTNTAGWPFAHDFRHTVYVGNQPVATYSRQSNGTNAWRYLIGDHQGSIASITDANGAVIVNESFSAFGERRDASDWSGPPSSAALTAMEGVARQGFTFHDMLPAGLIHMKGRVHDAITGRFLSADPYITEPGNTQNFNRYSYVYNNPLTFTDPSGYFGVIFNVDDYTGQCCAFEWSQAGTFTGRTSVVHYNVNIRVSGTVLNAHNIRASNGGNIIIAAGGGGTGTRDQATPAPPSPPTGASRRVSTRFPSAPERRPSVVAVPPPPSRPPVRPPEGPTREQIETATGAANVAFDAAKLSKGDGFGVWQGKNGKFYSESWGGNQHTGPRKMAMADRAVLGSVGKFFGVVGLAQSGVDVGVDIINGSDQLFEHSVDVGIGIYGLWGGVPGAVVGGAYFIGKFTGANDALARSRLPIVDAQLYAIDRYGTLGDCMCQW